MKKIVIWLFLMLMCIPSYAEVSHDTVTQYYVLRVPEEGSMGWTKTISDDFISIDSTLHNISNDISNGRVSHDIELSSYSIDGDGYIRLDTKNDGDNDFTFNTDASDVCSTISADGAAILISRNKGTGAGTPMVYFSPVNYNVLLGYTGDTRLVKHSDYLNAGNVVIGYNTGQVFNEGSYNVAIGGAYNNTGFDRYGNYNIGIGYSALEVQSSGDSCIGIGYNAGASHSKGDNSIFIGKQAGFINTSGVGCIFIGVNAGKNETRSSMLYINNDGSFDPIIKGDMSSDTLWFNRTVLVSKDVLTPHISADIVSVDCIATKYGKLSIDSTYTNFTDIEARNMTGDSMTCDVISMERIFFQSRGEALSPDLPATGRGVLYMSSDGTLKFGSAAGGWHEVLNFYTK